MLAYTARIQVIGTIVRATSIHIQVHTDHRVSAMKSRISSMLWSDQVRLIEPTPGGGVPFDRVTLLSRLRSCGVLARDQFEQIPLQILILYRPWRNRQVVGKN